MQDIADAQDDIDGLIVQYDAKTRRVPKIAAKIAIRLVKANQVNEARVYLDEAECRYIDDDDNWNGGDVEWENARIAAFDSLKRTNDAQKLRWKCFEATLSETHLRDKLQNLPDFEDLEAEEKACEYAPKFRSHTKARYQLAEP